MPLAAGTKLGGYEIVAPLGAGGMGEVYRARDTRLGREVAIKVLPEAVASDPDRRQRFEQEARAASALNHPNILTIHDVGSIDGTVYIAMELVEGRTLRELVASGEPLPTKRLLDVAVQTAEGLAKAHSAGIVHRDLKPENLMVSKDGFVKILDFGLAKLVEPVSQDASALPTAIAAPTQPGTVMGTAGYMSPEQATGQAVDFRSDQFTLGAILYEMATGKRAFQKKTGAETLVAIIKEEPEPLSQAAPRAPAPVRWIVERCLAKDPEERYASTTDLARDLKSLRDHLSETSFSGTVEAAAPAGGPRRRWLVPALAALLFGAGAALLLQPVLRGKPTSAVTFERLTFQRGRIQTARFAPDGQTIVYAAAWEGRPLEVYSTLPATAESRSLGIPGADVLSVSSRGELALSLGRHFYLGYESSGTLARVPLSGGAPREILEEVQDADWSPDGTQLAVARRVANRGRIEYPIGKVLYEMEGWISNVRISPDGSLLAFASHPQRGDVDGSVRVIDTSGKLRLEIPNALRGVRGVAWSPRGDEVWHSTVRPEFAILATTLAGKSRAVFGSPGLVLQDVSTDGRTLVSQTSWRREIVGLGAGESAERNLTWLNWSFPVGISPDGRSALFSEQQRAPPGAYVRRFDGSAAVRVGEGEAWDLSPDGKRVLAASMPDRDELLVIPLGAGETKRIPNAGIAMQWAYWLPDGRRILITGSEPGHKARLYLRDLEGGGKPRPVTPEGVSMGWGKPISADGRSIAARGADGVLAVYPIDGGTARPIPGIAPDELPVLWSKDGRSLYVTRFSEPPGVVEVVDVETGRRTPWKSFQPPDPSGVEVVGPIVIGPDETSYVYSYRRSLDDLYVVTGWR
jgi:Tol biopolymer transport system component